MRATNKDLRAWCENTWPTVYRHIYRLVQNKEEAEDLTQETYLRAVKKGFSKDEPPHLGYLMAVAVNLVRDSWRQKRARGVLSPLEEAALEVAARTDEAYESSVRDALARLPDEYREVIDLRIVQGYSRAETAQRLGKTEDAVRGLQYRALQALREVMKDHLEGVQVK
jgi:RNA polymerase sigma-70 factor (ECF subfamily)